MKFSCRSKKQAKGINNLEGQNVLRTIPNVITFYKHSFKLYDELELSDDENDPAQKLMNARIHRIGYFRRPQFQYNIGSPKLKNCLNQSVNSIKLLFQNLLASITNIPSAMLKPLPFFLVCIFIVISSLLTDRRRYNREINGITCLYEHQKGQTCLTRAAVDEFIIQLDKLAHVLNKHAEMYHCSENGVTDPIVSVFQARIYLENLSATRFTSKQWLNLLSLASKIGKWHNVLVYSGDNLSNSINDPLLISRLAHSNPSISLKCRLSFFSQNVWLNFENCLATLFGYLLSCLVSAICIAWITVILYGSYIMLVKMSEHRAYESCCRYEDGRKLLQTITNILDDWYFSNHRHPKYMSVQKIRERLASLHPNVREESFWKMIKQMVYNEAPHIAVQERREEGECWSLFKTQNEVFHSRFVPEKVVSSTNRWHQNSSSIYLNKYRNLFQTYGKPATPPQPGYNSHPYTSSVFLPKHQYCRQAYW